MLGDKSLDSLAVKVEDTLTLGLGVLIVFAGIGIFTCILVPYFQTLIILLLKKINF